MCTKTYHEQINKYLISKIGIIQNTALFPLKYNRELFNFLKSPSQDINYIDKLLYIYKKISINFSYI